MTHVCNEGHYWGRGLQSWVQNLQCHTLLQTHWLAPSGCITLRVELEAIEVNYFGKEARPNILTWNSADRLQQQARENCNTCIFLKDLTACWKTSTKSVQRLSSANDLLSELFELRDFLWNCWYYLWLFSFALLQFGTVKCVRASVVFFTLVSNIRI